MVHGEDCSSVVGDFLPCVQSPGSVDGRSTTISKTQDESGSDPSVVVVSQGRLQLFCLLRSVSNLSDIEIVCFVTLSNCLCWLEKIP